MLKYLFISVLAYYIFTKYVSPMLEAKIANKIKENKPEPENNNDEYIDYEEIK